MQMTFDRRRICFQVFRSSRSSIDKQQTSSLSKVPFVKPQPLLLSNPALSKPKLPDGKLIGSPRSLRVHSRSLEQLCALQPNNRYRDQSPAHRRSQPLMDRSGLRRCQGFIDKRQAPRRNARSLEQPHALHRSGPSIDKPPLRRRKRLTGRLSARELSKVPIDTRHAFRAGKSSIVKHQRSGWRVPW